MCEEELKEIWDETQVLLNLVPENLKAGKEINIKCPFCTSKLNISRQSRNGHLWIVCEKEGVLLCQ